MALDTGEVISFQEEREAQKRLATRRRILTLGVVGAIAIVARIVIKNPDPPKVADHTGKYLILPGALKKMSAADQAKLDPRLLAQLREADRIDREKKYFASNKTPQQPYKPSDVPLDNLRDKSLEEEFRYQYVRRVKIIEQKKDLEVEDPSKKMLVRLKNGRFVKARAAREVAPNVAIEIDRSIVASLPKTMILSVTNDALTWQEPVAKGQVKLKPAKGITITVNQKTAPRISIAKAFRNDS